MKDLVPYVVCYSLTDDMWVVYYRRHRSGIQPLERIAADYTKAGAWAKAHTAMIGRRNE